MCRCSNCDLAGPVGVIPGRSTASESHTGKVGKRALEYYLLAPCRASSERRDAINCVGWATARTPVQCDITGVCAPTINCDFVNCACGCSERHTAGENNPQLHIIISPDQRERANVVSCVDPQQRVIVTAGGCESNATAARCLPLIPDRTSTRVVIW